MLKNCFRNIASLRWMQLQMGRSLTNPTKWPVRPALGPCYPLSAQLVLWSDRADAQADPSVRCAHRSFRWFCQAHAQMMLNFSHNMYILEQISNATDCNFKYFSSDISYQAYFSYVSAWGHEKAFVRKEILNSCNVTSSDEISWN